MLPSLAALTQSPLRDVSILFSARALGYLIGSVLVGRLYDRVRGHPLMVGTIITMALMLLVMPSASALLWLAALMLVLGSAEGGLDVGANTLIVWVHGERVAPFMNGLHFFFGAGAFVAPLLVAGTLLASGGLTWAFWSLALLLLPCGLWIARVASPPARHAAEGSAQSVVNPYLLFIVVLFFFLYACAEVGFGGWIYTYAVTLRLADEATAAYVTSTFWGALTVGRLVAIPLAAHYSPQRILAADLLCALASLALILGAGSLPALLWVGVAGLGLSYASVFPTMIALAERHLAINGRITAWFFVGASIGGIVWPWFIGQLFEPVGPAAVIIVVTCAVLAALVVLGIIGRYAK